MPSIYQPRRPRASPLCQLVHHGWSFFSADYEKKHRPTLGPLKSATITTVESFLRCGDLASGFTRLECSDCGHERLLAFTCKTRHFCPACHQRRVRSTSEWIATAVCHEVPHRQFVFTIPKVLRGIFRKRRQLLTHLFHTATETLRDAFRTRLHLPDGRIGAIAAVHTFGDYLIFHPHLHVLAANDLFTPDGHFHCMPAEDLEPAIELFRHGFLHALREAKLISHGKLADLLSWKHSGFHIHDGGVKPVAAHDSAGRKRLAEYLLRHPFSLQKITWNASTQTVIYRSKRHHNTKRNFEIFKAPDFIAAALLHLQQNAQAHVPTRDLKQKVATEIRRIFNAEDRAHAEAKLAEFIKTYEKGAPKLATWAEQNIPEGLTVFGFPEASRQRLRTSNMCETLNSQIKRRTRVVGLFPNESSLLRLVTGVVIEISEEWETGKIYLQPETKKQPN